MCSRATCRQCGKPTWSGCGNHIEQALAGVPKDKRCRCRELRQEKKAAGGGGLWSSLFSRTPGR